MGDPKRQSPKYSTPNHPWLKDRIETETALQKEYGLKTKTEIWKMKAVLKDFAIQAKHITAFKTAQSEKEKAQMLNRLSKLGLLPATAQMDNVLALTPKDIMERRLQTLVFRKGLAKSMKQARQFITHRHILLNGKKLTAPGYLVPKELEGTITFSPNSQLADDMHPERVQKQEMLKKEAAPESKAEQKEAKKEQKPVKKAHAKTEKKEQPKKEKGEQ